MFHRDPDGGGLAVSERSSLGERIAALETLIAHAMELEEIRDATIRRELHAAVAEIRSAVAVAHEQILLRFENVNEWRNTFGDLARNAVSTQTFEAEVKALDAKIAVNTDARIAAVAQAEEREKEEKRRAADRDKEQRNIMWRVGVAVTVLSTLIGLVLRLFKI